MSKPSAPTPSTAPAHTLPSLLAALGPSTPDEALALVDGASKKSLAKDGAAVATPRITTDAARMYGEAFDFLAHATDAQLDEMPLMSRDWLRIAVASAVEGDKAYASLTAHASGEAGKQAAANAGADALSAEVEAKRGQLHVALVGLAAGDPALLAVAETAFGSAADPGGAVRAQTALARAWRVSGSPAIKARLKKSRLTEEWLAKADALAGRASSAALAAAATRTKGTRTQGDVDLIDGVNLALLRTLVGVFEAAHAADPSIPRVTFNALRAHVHRSHHAAPAPAPAGGATAGATA